MGAPDYDELNRRISIVDGAVQQQKNENGRLLNLIRQLVTVEPGQLEGKLFVQLLDVPAF